MHIFKRKKQIETLSKILSAAVLSFAALAACDEQPTTVSTSRSLQATMSTSDGTRPNFLVIVADDLGFSDLGSYGGEIRTPHLDRLAREGMRFTDFYVGSSCSPTRAMLMTGLDNHRVGLGNMFERTAPNQIDIEGYEGVLTRRVPTIAERLQNVGYRTYMSGKWHLGHSPAHIPHARGFDRSFTLLNGGGSHFDMTGANNDNPLSEFNEDGAYLRSLPRGHYSSRTFTEKLISYFEADRDNDAPYFAYLAFQAPHDPLQVPDNWLRRYQGAYDDGWDTIRAKRLARQQQMGMFPASAQVAPRLWYVPAWEDLLPAAQVQTARKMEVYASMVEFLDDQVGQLLTYLEESGELDNTVVLFFSDNGAEGADPIPGAKRRPTLASSAFYPNNYNTRFEAYGRSYSFMAYGAPWAQVSSTPFNGYKGSSYEGGVRAPLIAWMPEMARAGTINTDAIMHVLDIAPTIAQLAGANTNGMQGRTWVPVLEGQACNPRPNGVVASQFFGAPYARRGDLKAVRMPEPFGPDEWQIFNVRNDPGETRDLSAQMPGQRNALIAAYNSYAAQNNIVVPNRTPYDGLVDLLPPRPPTDDDGWPRGQEPNFEITDE